MNIQSTAVRPAQTPRAKLSEDFKEKKESFLAVSNDFFERSDSYYKWANRIGFGLGAGVLAGGTYLMSQLLPGPADYGTAFPPVLAAAGTVWATIKIAQSMLAKELKKADFQHKREDLVQARDQYRTALLDEVNDPGVTEIVNKRWDSLKEYEEPKSKFPTNVELRLLDQVDQLEFLANQRADGPGWMKSLAHAQDDPARFQEEAEIVKENPGIHKVLVDSVGTQQS